jgi:hypothetical protein
MRVIHFNAPVQLQGGFCFQVLVAILITIGPFMRAITRQFTCGRCAVTTGNIEFKCYCITCIVTKARTAAYITE